MQDPRRLDRLRLQLRGREGRGGSGEAKAGHRYHRDCPREQVGGRDDKIGQSRQTLGR